MLDPVAVGSEAGSKPIFADRGAVYLDVVDAEGGTVKASLSDVIALLDLEFLPKSNSDFFDSMNS